MRMWILKVLFGASPILLQSILPIFPVSVQRVKSANLKSLFQDSSSAKRQAYQMKLKVSPSLYSAMSKIREVPTPPHLKQTLKNLTESRKKDLENISAAISESPSMMIRLQRKYKENAVPVIMKVPEYFSQEVKVKTR